ncbi:DUF2169 domain-containing protein [Pseudenhygromyxa sp. WMMC2535]|uniref:DUF2169 family type VI secretion system accessory protein n=1 Tax=Pseudenhygromyxa sp. WMMC2535 TaxID=2712867 RepID=UPI0015553D98|nr:DUF2169 domain-containing protein [Pseudenhygromyxa sp. WMMC2535]NVB39020.1 DUF2169 domain-containing protein [Pseudenhygromyxa sp. WMMC2535]
MKVIKPGKLSALTRCFEHQRRFYLGVSAVAFVPFGDGLSMLSEIGMWTFVADRLGTQIELDASVPKAKAEFIVAGSAFTPGGQPQPHCAVRAKVAEREKILYVHGDRHWIGARASAPAPFTQLPLDWSLAYGGPSYARNPLGKGSAPMLIEGVEIQPLPNVESPSQRVESPRQAVEPASFLPVDLGWPQRQALAGTYDQHWLDNLFPGYAADVDWEIFNVAQADQRLERPFRPGDVYEFENLHPTRPLIRGALPALAARAFVTRKPTGPSTLHEVPLSLQTLWAFPDAERMIMVFTGSIQVAEEDASDVLALVLAAERSGEARTLDHYAAVLAERLDPEKAALAALRDDPLVPAELVEVEDATFAEERELGANEGLLQANMFRKAEREFAASRALVASFGLDPDIHGPPAPTRPTPPPSPEQLPRVIETLRAEAEAQRVAEQARLAQRTKEIDAMVDALGVEGLDSASLAAERGQTPVGPPTFTAEGQRELLAGIARESRARGTVIDEIEEMIVDTALFARWLDAEQRLREGYRLTAHLQAPAPAMDSSLTAACRARVSEAVAAKQPFSKLNLTGADLSGMNLAGADLSGAFLEGARLDGADLRGADLSKAVLAHASLEGVRFDAAKLVGANLGKAKLHACVFDGADLGEAVLSGAELRECSLDGARLLGAELGEASFHQTRARGVEARSLQLIRVDLRGLDLGGADLRETNFIEGKLDATPLAGARLDGCTFYKCTLAGADLSGASLDNARFVEGCVLDEATLSEAKLTRAHLRGSSLRGADLRRAILDDSDLSECDLSAAKLYQAVARRARFERAELAEAELMSANLMHASFSRARIHGVDLRGANLYGADMARVRSDERVLLDEALLTKVRVLPRYDPSSDPDAGPGGPGQEAGRG